jgi:hypothetical protein
VSKRGNGLTASSYAPLADIPTRLSDAMLAALRDAGIAAYAVPSPGRQGGLGGLRPFAEPTDRLFADAAERDLARSVLQAQLPRFVDDAEVPGEPHETHGEGAAAERGAAGDTGGDTDDGEPRGPDGPAAMEARTQDAPDSPARREARDTPELDEDAIFAEIMAAYDDPPAAGSRWPELEDLDGPYAEDDSASGTTATGPDRAGDPATERPAAGRAGGGRTAADPAGADHPGADPATTDRPATRGLGGDGLESDRLGADRPTTEHPAGRVVKPAEGRSARTGSGPGRDTGGHADDDDEGHYEPPTPPPLPGLDPVTKGAWAALFGGPLYLLASAMLGWEVPGWSAFAAVAAFVGGFVTLVVRMGDEPRGSGPDDGAVV